MNLFYPKNRLSGKVAAFITLFLFYPIFLMAQEPRINLKGKDMTFQQVFEQIEAQSSYTIAYNQTKFAAIKKVSPDIQNLKLKEALTLLLKDIGFTFKIEGKHIIILPSKENKKDTPPPATQQTIRGVVRDKASGSPLPFVTVMLLNQPTLRGTTTDSTGHFLFERLPVGRYDIQASFMGYEPAVVREILLTSARESQCEISLNEQLFALEEVTVKAPVNKEQPLNTMALTGGRMLSVEEASRYAGGSDDPARLVSSFAGVAGNFVTNSIAVRGNSPQFLQWRLEGVEVPNPTHFADISGLGGGIFTALSSQVMGNSDFFNGAFPAEYSNALSGVFDMSMRIGNNQRHEHTIQLGTLGLDIASEGPLSKAKRSSYIFNYRYSTTGLIKAAVDGLDLKYQDLSFKLNFPSAKAGTFSIWGLGLIDANTQDREKDPDKWESYSDRSSSSIDMSKAAGGITHKYFFGNDAFVKTSLAMTYAKNELKTDLLNSNTMQICPDGAVKSTNWDIAFSSYLNKKFNARHTNRTGITVTGLLYDMNYEISPTPSLYEPPVTVASGKGSDAEISVFSSSVIRLNEKLTANVGITAQLFTLNNNITIEPRASLKWNITGRQSLAVAYGLHSRREKLDYYYIKTPATGNQLVNKDLKFAKAHHITLSYGYSLTPDLFMKIEPYFQYLFDVPTEPGSSFSIINHDLWYLDRILVNDGKGRNYGIDFTLEHYLTKGFYYLFTGSVFKSEYYGSDKVWRNTRFNRGYLFNALAGKEWMIGRQQQNIFSANVRFTYQGGDRFSPIDEEASHAIKDIEIDETRAFSEQFPSIITADFTVSYRLNRKRISHEFAVKLLNATGQTGQYGYIYKEKTGKIERLDVNGLFLPNISYKIQF